MIEHTEQRQVKAMTDNELDELEALDPEERARLLERKDKFVLSSKTADIVVNDLLNDDDAKLGRLFRDLVAFNVDGSTALLDNTDSKDKCDVTARHLLYNDSNVFISKWLLTSKHNASNRKGKTKDSKTEPERPAPESINSEQYVPTFDEVLQYAPNCLGGEPQDVIERTANRWYNSVTKNHWLDDRGDPIRNWRKVFKSYCDKSWLARSLEKQNG